MVKIEWFFHRFTRTIEYIGYDMQNFTALGKTSLMRSISAFSWAFSFSTAADLPTPTILPTLSSMLSIFVLRSSLMPFLVGYLIIQRKAVLFFRLVLALNGLPLGFGFLLGCKGSILFGFDLFGFLFLFGDDEVVSFQMLLACQIL